MVAFGSGANDPGGMWEFFSTKVHQGMPVLIHVSTTGSEGEHHGLVFSHSAVFDRVEATEEEIVALRPDSALESDTPHGCYWVVREFKLLKKSEFVPFAKYKINPPLHRPVVKQKA
jgi:hypothetical protein